MYSFVSGFFVVVVCLFVCLFVCLLVCLFFRRRMYRQKNNKRHILGMNNPQIYSLGEVTKVTEIEAGNRSALQTTKWQCNHKRR